MRTKCVFVAGSLAVGMCGLPNGSRPVSSGHARRLATSHAVRRWTGTRHYHRSACANGTGELHRRRARAERPGDTGQCRGIVLDTPRESGVRGLIWIIAGMFLLLSPYVMTVQQHAHRRGDECDDLVYHDAHTLRWHLPTAIVLAIVGRGDLRPVQVGAPARRRAEQSQRGTDGRD
jgi:hypothetical protein